MSDDTIYGGADEDTIRDAEDTGGDSDRLFGWASLDSLDAFDEDDLDSLHGGSASDRCHGDEGDAVANFETITPD